MGNNQVYHTKAAKASSVFGHTWGSASLILGRHGNHTIQLKTTVLGGVITQSYGVSSLLPSQFSWSEKYRLYFLRDGAQIFSFRGT